MFGNGCSPTHAFNLTAACVCTPTLYPQVVVRVRPLVEREQGQPECIKVTDDQVRCT